jgi:hypothetical protein
MIPMRELRYPATRRVLSSLDSSFLTRHAFDASFNNENGEIVALQFRENPRFEFKITQSQNGDRWTVTECPGVTFTDAEVYAFTEYGQAANRISAWVQRIIEDLALQNRAEHVDFSELRKSINEAADHVADPDKPFNVDEAADWKERLDTLVERFETLKDQNQIQEQELRSLKNEVANLKETISRFPKRVWIKSAGNKILNIFEKIANSESGMRMVEKVVKVLLEKLS